MEQSRSHQCICAIIYDKVWYNILQCSMVMNAKTCAYHIRTQMKIKKKMIEIINLVGDLGLRCASIWHPCSSSPYPAGYTS